MINAKTWNPAQIDQAIRRLEGIIRSGSYNPAEINQLLNQLGEPGYINTWNPAELDQKLRTLLYDLLTWKTATGNPIQLRTNNGGLVQSCEVTFSPIQDLHGYGNPWPAGGEKNKLPFDLATIKANNTDGTWSGNNYTYNGVTWTVNDDGTYIANGTVTNGFSVLLVIGNNSQSSSTVNLSFPTTDYKITTGFTIDGTNSTYEIGYRPAGSSGAAKHIYNNNGYALLSTDINLIQLVIREGYTANNLKFEPMIVATSVSDYTFVPYSNICPISGRDGLNLYQAGVNLANTTIYKQGYVLGSDGSETVNANYCITDKCIVTAGKSYVLKFKENSGGIVSDNVIRIGWYKSNGDFISRSVPTNNTQYVTAPTNTAYCKLSYNNNIGSDNYKWDIMLNEGQTALDYVPYQGSTHTATFSDTVYGGVWKPQEGKAVIDTLITTHDKNSDWTRNTSGIFYVNAPSGIDDLVACNSFKPYIPNGSSTLIPDLNCRLNNVKTFINFKMLSCDTLEEFKQAIDGLTIQVAYKIAAPTEITLTAEQIELLKGQNVLWTDGDNIEITYKKLLLPSDVESLSKIKKIEENQKTKRSKKKKEE